MLSTLQEQQSFFLLITTKKYHMALKTSFLHSSCSNREPLNLMIRKP